MRKLEKEQNKVQELLIEYINTYYSTTPLEMFFTNDVYNEFCSKYNLGIGIRKFGRELSKLGYKSVSVRVDGKIERVIRRK